ncbi:MULTISPECIES: NAD-dependent deacylase [unclassified Paracoccus (in: a-proteobacteria)]|uniref:NAD-dependent deacylase n=1 Tax=unclassified Paracoccus (in: a-proteobacteria) TaxID=2688777 RepID=UPI0012B40B56|nr:MULTISPECIES: NAD-dependent deacylase [unclassified Paracoccus (in: a-proteobacteria)]UXU74851.1 NAD-dependent deacylase [Paracoccus sp. SMMA_5]UXU80751.1 NAD-dependent deacylase [Paracoccus sp. SMMA_5_TC]
MRIAVLTGAGISAESGIRTFRATDGLWEEHRIEDVATPDGFRRNPVLVHRFYNMRRADAARAQPNAAHRALARLARHHDVTLITQNVDDLHERGGSTDVIHMHGSLLGALCAHCGHRWPATLIMRSRDPCPACNTAATRPDIVWFGEIPYHMERIWAAVEDADIFAAIGTSGQVYPAAGLAQHARRHGAQTVELNLTASAISGDFMDHRTGPATQVVPAWVDELCR